MNDDAAFPGHIVLQTRLSGEVAWRTFREPLEIISTCTPEDISTAVSLLDVMEEVPLISSPLFDGGLSRVSC